MPLPDGWRWVALNDVQADEPRAITDGPFGSNLTSAHYTQAGPRVVRLQNIGDGKFVDAQAHISPAHFAGLRQHEVNAGDLLIASLGDDPPRACIAPAWLGPAIVKADCIRVRLGNHVDPRWVLYSLQTEATRRWCAEKTYGVGRPRLGLKAIRAIPVPLAPLDEQQRIVEILEDHLSRLDAADSQLNTLGGRLAALQHGLLTHELLGASLAPEPGTAPLTEVGTDDGVLAGLPKGWAWRRLHELADVAGGVTKDSKRQADPSYVEVPYLRVANVQRGRLDLSTVTNIRVPEKTATQLRLLPEDVLLNEGGDRDKLGRGWVWEGQVANCIHQNHVFRARVRDRAMDPYLLSWAANTLGGPWCERNGKQSVNLASISLSRIRMMPIPVPPVDAQPAIVARIRDGLNAATRLDNSAKAARRRGRALRRSLLATAFSGQLNGHSANASIEAGRVSV